MLIPFPKRHKGTGVIARLDNYQFYFALELTRTLQQLCRQTTLPVDHLLLDMADRSLNFPAYKLHLKGGINDRPIAMEASAAFGTDPEPELLVIPWQVLPVDDFRGYHLARRMAKVLIAGLYLKGWQIQQYCVGDGVEYITLHQLQPDAPIPYYHLLHITLPR